ncbi:MAG: hypothetical protein ACKVOQ_05495 [Cyclobacteriaceae bacterium]
MKKWKKIFRAAGFVILVLCASTGLFAGALMLPRTREKYMNKEIATELVDKERKKSGGGLKIE